MFNLAAQCGDGVVAIMAQLAKAVVQIDLAGEVVDNGAIGGAKCTGGAWRTADEIVSQDEGSCAVVITHSGTIRTLFGTSRVPIVST
jgi:broad specificity phosphatase PhoE